MRKVTRKAVMASLEKDWDGYLGRLTTLSAAETEKFLKHQGFAATADLLIHIAAWWKECMKNIDRLVKDPAYRPPKIDVDEFNRKAIEENKGHTERATMALFTKTLSEITGMIRNLPDSAFERDSINDYLYWCITNHFTEHKSP
jgi:hypothetical protein